MTWALSNPQCNESKKIVWEVAQYLRGRGLDVGAGDFKILPHVISVDDMNHAQFGFTHKPDVLCDAAKLDVFASQTMDFVYSSHTLEHMVDYRAALKEWWRVIKQSGLLILYLPHAKFYPNIGEEGANPDHKHDFLPADILAALPEGHDVLVCDERNEDYEYSMLLVVRKLNGRHKHHSFKLPKPEKTACVVRYGAYGDLMQSASVWSALRAEGYHVTVFSSLPGASVVEHDPNIDNLVLFDKDQVPNAHLQDFWGWQKRKFTKFVNLSESVEGTLLSMPGRTVHFFPPAARETMNNHNYVAMQHMLAGVPYTAPLSKFYTTPEERKWAEKEKEKLGVGHVIMWSLAGSSVHKTWAGLDSVLACIMLDYTDAKVVLVGGPEAEMLEAGWENEPRIIKTSGKWSMRQTLSFARLCDLVIGPETGVLNAMAMEPMAKIVFLSHSTVENLTRDWRNTRSLYSRNTTCKGRGANEAAACHQLHYGWDHCTKDAETGTAQCQKDIGVEEVWQAVYGVLNAE